MILVEMSQDGGLRHFIWAKFSRKDLDSDVFVEVVVAAQPYGAETAVAKLVKDAISTLAVEEIINVNGMVASFLVFVQVLYIVVGAVEVGAVGCGWWG